MDVELARTFIEIVTTRSFVKAAERLNVAQTTVSARVKTLEEQLGRPLFMRSKGGATLTPAGKQFLQYAPAFVQLWQQALHQVAIPSGHESVLTLGSEVALAKPLLLDWIAWMRREHPKIALRVHVDVPQDLITHIARGFVDAAIVYAPVGRPGLTTDFLLEEQLILVSTDESGAQPSNADYVFVDWGQEFLAQHVERIAGRSRGLFMNLRPLALDYVLQMGGAGCFRSSAVRPHLLSGRLTVVADAPRFSHPVYVVYSNHTDQAVLRAALHELRSLPDDRSG